MRNAGLRILKGPDQGRVHRLRHASFRIGSDSRSDLALDDRYVAAEHAEIVRHSDGSFSLRRHGLNPIYVDGVEVLQETPLKPNATLVLSPAVQARFEAEVPAAVSGPAPDSRWFASGLNVRRLGKLALFVVLPSWAVMAFWAWDVRAGRNKVRFEPTDESFQANVVAGMTGAECVPVKGVVVPPGYAGAAEAFRGQAQKGVQAEQRAAWNEAMLYYDGALQILANPKCQPVRYTAVRREQVRPRAESNRGSR